MIVLAPYGETFYRSQCAEPFGGEPYTIAIDGVKAGVIKLSSSKGAKVLTGKDQLVPSWELGLSIVDDYDGCSTGDGGEGLLKIHKAWQGEDSEEVLYSCHIEMNVEYSEETEDHGHGGARSTKLLCGLSVFERRRSWPSSRELIRGLPVSNRQ